MFSTRPSSAGPASVSMAESTTTTTTATAGIGVGANACLASVRPMSARHPGTASRATGRNARDYVQLVGNNSSHANLLAASPANVRTRALSFPASERVLKTASTGLRRADMPERHDRPSTAAAVSSAQVVASGTRNRASLSQKKLERSIQSAAFLRLTASSRTSSAVPRCADGGDKGLQCPLEGDEVGGKGAPVSCSVPFLSPRTDKMVRMYLDALTSRLLRKAEKYRRSCRQESGHDARGNENEEDSQPVNAHAADDFAGKYAQRVRDSSLHCGPQSVGPSRRQNQTSRTLRFGGSILCRARETSAPGVWLPTSCRSKAFSDHERGTATGVSGAVGDPSPLREDDWTGSRDQNELGRSKKKVPEPVQRVPWRPTGRGKGNTVFLLAETLSMFSPLTRSADIFALMHSPRVPQPYSQEKAHGGDVSDAEIENDADFDGDAAAVVDNAVHEDGSEAAAVQAVSYGGGRARSWNPLSPRDRPSPWQPRCHRTLYADLPLSVGCLCCRRLVALSWRTYYHDIAQHRARVRKEARQLLRERRQERAQRVLQAEATDGLRKETTDSMARQRTELKGPRERLCFPDDGRSLSGVHSVLYDAPCAVAQDVGDAGDVADFVSSDGMESDDYQRDLGFREDELLNSDEGGLDDNIITSDTTNDLDHPPMGNISSLRHSASCLKANGVLALATSAVAANPHSIGVGRIEKGPWAGKGAYCNDWDSRNNDKKIVVRDLRAKKGDTTEKKTGQPLKTGLRASSLGFGTADGATVFIPASLFAYLPPSTSNHEFYSQLKDPKSPLRSRINRSAQPTRRWVARGSGGSCLVTTDPPRATPESSFSPSVPLSASTVTAPVTGTSTSGPTPSLTTTNSSTVAPPTVQPLTLPSYYRTLRPVPPLYPSAHSTTFSLHVHKGEWEGHSK